MMAILVPLKFGLERPSGGSFALTFAVISFNFDIFHTYLQSCVLCMQLQQNSSYNHAGKHIPAFGLEHRLSRLLLLIIRCYHDPSGRLLCTLRILHRWLHRYIQFGTSLPRGRTPFRHARLLTAVSFSLTMQSDALQSFGNSVSYCQSRTSLLLGSPEDHKTHRPSTGYLLPHSDGICYKDVQGSSIFELSPEPLRGRNIQGRFLCGRAIRHDTLFECCERMFYYRRLFLSFVWTVALC